MQDAINLLPNVIGGYGEAFKAFKQNFGSYRSLHINNIVEDMLRFEKILTKIH